VELRDFLAPYDLTIGEVHEMLGLLRCATGYTIASTGLAKILKLDYGYELNLDCDE